MFVQRILLLLVVITTPLRAEEVALPEEMASRPIDQVVEALVAAGLERNLGLAAQSLDLQRAEQALNEARSALRPQLDLNARYSVSRGGRDIDVPLSDLLNPVYSTLNQLLQQQGHGIGLHVLEPDLRHLRGLDHRPVGVPDQAIAEVHRRKRLAGAGAHLDQGAGAVLLLGCLVLVVGSVVAAARRHRG